MYGRVRALSGLTSYPVAAEQCTGRGYNRSCTAVDVHVPCSHVQQSSRTTLGSTVVTCTVSAAWLSEKCPYFLRDGVFGF